MLTYPNIRYSERDCRENPAKHHLMRKITMNSLNQNGALQIGTESPIQHPSPSSRLRSFVAIVLGRHSELAIGRGEGRHGADGINWGSGLVLAEPLALTGAQVSNSISAASIASIYTSPANMEGSILTMAGYFTQLVGGGLAGKDVPGIPIGYIYNSYKLIRNNYHAML